MNDERLAHALDGPPGSPVLVMSSSLGTTVDMWLPQLPALNASWRLLRIDHPGHGASPVWSGEVTVERMGQAVLDLLDTLSLERVSWCGLSLGGAIGQWIAAHAPHRIDKLILCCTSARFDATVYRERAALVRDRGLAPIVDAVLARWFTPRFVDLQPDVVENFQAMLAGISPEGYAACCEAVAAFDARPYLASITAPTLVIAGNEDRATPVDNAQTLCDAIPHARLQIIPAAAHLANVEQAEAVTAAIQAHVQQPAQRH